jgi:hypothetical protein
MLSKQLPRLRMCLPAFTKHLLATIFPAQEPLYAVTLDVKHAFYQVAVHHSSQHLTRFQFWRGGPHFIMNRLPMGLASSPAVIQSLLTSILRNFSWQPLFSWLHLHDFLIIGTKTWFDQYFSKFLQHLQAANVTLNTKKSILIPSKLVQYCGLWVNLYRQEVHPTKDKIQKLIILLAIYSSRQRLPDRAFHRLEGYLSYVLPAIGLSNSLLQLPQPFHYFFKSLQYLKPRRFRRSNSQ